MEIKIVTLVRIFRKNLLRRLAAGWWLCMALELGIEHHLSYLPLPPGRVSAPKRLPSIHRSATAVVMVVETAMVESLRLYNLCTRFRELLRDIKNLKTKPRVHRVGKNIMVVYTDRFNLDSAQRS